MIGQAFLAAVASLAWAAAPLPAKPTAYATDHAGVFDPARLSALNEKLAGFERTTSNQVLVYVDHRIPAGTTLEEMAAEAVRTWGVGQKGRSNGVILFVFVDDKAMRLEVGYGLEGPIPDARAKQITSEVIKPSFKQGDYAGGVEAGVDAVFAAANGEAYVGTGRTVAEKRRADSGVVPEAVGPLLPLGLALGALLWRFGTHRRGRVLVGVAMVMFATALGSLLAAVGCAQPYWLFLAFPTLVIGVVLAIVSWSMAAARRTRSAGTGTGGWVSSSSGESYSSSDSGSSSSSSSDSSSSSSSDFSGGGGDSGGGGSSDSW